MLSLIIVLGLVGYDFCGYRKISNMFGIWCLLWLILPLPLNLDKSLVLSLQLLSSHLSSLILDLVGVNHLMTGNVLELPGKSLFVDEACSGIVSVMAVIACSAIYSVWLNRSLLHASLLLVSSVGWAVLLNVVRISAIAVAQSWWNYDLSKGIPHDALGMGLFAITFVAMMSTDQILCFVLCPIQLVGVPDNERNRNFLISGWNRVTTAFTPKSFGSESDIEGQDTLAPPFRDLKLTGGAFAVLGIAHVVIWGTVSVPLSDSFDSAHALDMTVLPSTFGTWTLENFRTIRREQDDAYGEYSKVYRFVRTGSDLVVNVSIDFPFRGSWHELSYCYHASGWGRPDRHVIDRSEKASFDNWSYVEANYKHRNGSFGHLLFSIFDASGDRVSPPAGKWAERFWRRMRRRGPSSTWPQMLQIQAWVESDSKIPDQLSAEILDLFLESRRRLHQAVSSPH
jgi:exosortase